MESNSLCNRYEWQKLDESNRPLSNYAASVPANNNLSRGFVPSFHNFAVFSRTKPRSVIRKWSVCFHRQNWSTRSPITNFYYLSCFNKNP